MVEEKIENWDSASIFLSHITTLGGFCMGLKRFIINKASQLPGKATLLIS